MTPAVDERRAGRWLDRPVLVTGATGMVGSILAERLVELGAHVVALVLDHDPRSELYRSGAVESVSVVSGRLERFDDVERAIVLHDIDTVFHLGAQTLVGAARRAPLATLEANVRGTWNVLEACRQHGSVVHSVVVASSDKAYGTVEHLPYHEEMPLAGQGPYEVSKSCADLIAQAYSSTYAVPVGIARCGNIFGPGDLNWSRIVPGTIRSLLHDEQPVIRSDGTLVRDYLYVDDVVDAYLLLAEHVGTSRDDGRVFNFSDESPRTVMEMYDAVCEAAGRPGTEPRVLGEAPGEIVEQYLSAARAREVLGWKARADLATGLRATVDWYRAFFGAPR